MVGRRGRVCVFTILALSILAIEFASPGPSKAHPSPRARPAASVEVQSHTIKANPERLLIYWTQALRMRLSLGLQDHLIAYGRMRARDEFRACTRRAPVEVFRRSRGRWRFVRNTFTDARGAFLVRLPDRRGRYVAFSRWGIVTDYDQCNSTVSAVRQQHPWVLWRTPPRVKSIG